MYTNNCYRFGARLITTGGNKIHSNEGTTQGDPIAIGIYAIGITPLIFADDLCGAGKIHNVKIWWDKVCYFGPLIGYHPNPQKSRLITKDKMLGKATSEFKNTGLNITKDGRKHLGSIIGTTSYKDQFISEKINAWCKELEYTFPEFLNYAKTGVTHFCGKKASDSNTLSASLLIFKISHPLEKKKCIF